METILNFIQRGGKEKSWRRMLEQKKRKKEKKMRADRSYINMIAVGLQQKKISSKKGRNSRLELVELLKRGR